MFQLNAVFSYNFVDTGIFRYFKLEISYRLLNRHALASVKNIVEIFSSYSVTLLSVQEDYTQVLISIC